MMKFYGLVCSIDHYDLNVVEFARRHDAEERLIEIFCEKIKTFGNIIQEYSDDVDGVVKNLREKIRVADRTKDSILEGINVSGSFLVSVDQGRSSSLRRFYYGVDQTGAWCDSMSIGYHWKVTELVYPESKDTSERICMQWLTDIDDQKGYAENVHLIIYPTLREYSLFVSPYIDNGDSCVDAKRKSDIYALAESLNRLGYTKREK